jgi:type I restriction enzyme, S subunit
MISDMKEYRLEEVCSHFRSGFGITSPRIFPYGAYPVYGGNGLRGFTETFTHEGGFLLIGRQGALCGNILVVSGQNYISEHAIAVQTKKDHCLLYLAYKLIYDNLNKLSESSAQPGLSVAKLLKYKVLLPPLPEQRKIAEILSTWDEAIEKLELLIEKKKLLKKGLMQQLLTGKKRFPGFTEEWKEVRLGDVGTVQTGKTPARDNTLLWGGDICWAKAVDFKSKYILDTQEHISKRGAEQIRLLPTGSVLISCIASIGLNAIALAPMATNQQINAIIVSELYDNEFIYYLMEYLTPDLKRLAGKTAVPIVSKSEFIKMKISVPGLSEQRKISDILANADYDIETLSKKKQLLAIQKKGLMQQLLTGKLRVSHNL